jgi:DNA-binding LytR/AlgR family response regulator
LGSETAYKHSKEFRNIYKLASNLDGERKMKHWIEKTKEETLDTVIKLLEPKEFFRINRSIIVQQQLIDKIETSFNSRYSLKLIPDFKDNVIVSSERVKDFREWLEG